MQEPIDYKPLASKVIFRLIGLFIVLLFLFANPIVLRPRFWTASVVARSITIGTVLLVIGLGFMCLRRWAAFLSFAVAEYVAFSETGVHEFQLVLTLIFIVPLVLTVVFWRNLVWGNKLRNSLLVFASIAASATVEYIAFLIRP